jgi:predicted transcriptional regulator
MKDIIMKRLSKAKKNILQLMWEEGTPITPEQIMTATGLSRRSIRAHLQGLEQAGCIQLSGYRLTSAGKQLLGFPSLQQESVIKILRTTTKQEAFHFYKDFHQPLNIFATSLSEFNQKLKAVDDRAINFHLTRDHIARWVTFLGDKELAAKLDTLKTQIISYAMSASALRDSLSSIISQRYAELAALAS